MIEENETQNLLRQLPGIDAVLHTAAVALLIEKYGRPLVTYTARKVIDALRAQIIDRARGADGSIEAIAANMEKLILSIAGSSFKPVINATGIILHTNLGRAPMGDQVVNDIVPLIQGYSNLEFDLKAGARGSRNDHIAELLCYLTGAQGVVAVNNNAAALILVLQTLAKGREVLISRGELIEIGGAFRIPEIMKAGNVKMVEVGTTNRTRLSDYEKAVTSKTALIVKAHKSNYAITGFTEEVSVADLSAFATKSGIPFLYDIGSGLLRNMAIPALQNEPDVQSSIRAGADLVAFSCDKLLGGPQAGIVAGRADLVKKLAKAPLMRALRLGKLPLAALASAARHYIDDKKLSAVNPIFSLLERSSSERLRLAQLLHEGLRHRGIASAVVESTGQVGGGTMPELALPSFAVSLLSCEPSGKKRSVFAEKLFHALLGGEYPVLGVLREGKLLFDTCALFESQIDPLIERIANLVPHSTV